MGERLPRTEEVGSSNLLCSTRLKSFWILDFGFDNRKSAIANLIMLGRARRGGSGALLPAIRYSGVEFPV